MSDDVELKTKVELEKRLKASLPVDMKIAFEAVSFDPPNEAHVRCQLLPTGTIDPVVGSAYRRETFSFQVFAVAPIGQGTGEVIELAGTVKAAFPRGLTIIKDNLRIQFFNTPSVSANRILDDGVIKPVIIPVTVEVYDL